MDKSELYIYIDESGTMDIGKNGQYFVICALVLDDFQGKKFASIVKQIIRETSKSEKIKEIHASQMSPDNKKYFFKHVYNIDYKVHYLVIDKNNIHSELFRNKDVCFNYMVQMLISPLLTKTDVLNIYVTVDERSVKTTSKKSLEDYLRVELLKYSLYSKQVFVRYEDSRRCKNLQATDMFANAIYRKYNYGKDDMYLYFSEKVSASVTFSSNIDN